MAPPVSITADELARLLAKGWQVQDLAGMSTVQVQDLIDSGRSRPKGILNKATPIPASIASAVSQARSASSARPVPQTSLSGALLNTPLAKLATGPTISGLGRTVAERVIKPAVNTARGAIGRSSSSVGVRALGKYGPASSQGSQDGLGEFGLPSFDAPELQYRDFSGQARDQISGIYQPRYAAIDQASQNAQDQYRRSDQITAGLYQNLAKNITDIAARSAAQYRDAQATQAANTDQLVQSQGQNYSGAQAQEARLLQQLGQGEAAKQVLGDNTTEQAYQQSQAQSQGNAQSAAMAQQDLASQDYYRNMGNANQTGGTVARQNLIAQLGDVLQSYDRDRMNLRGDEAQATLQLGQQLSDRDFAAQQANYGIARDEYGARVDQQRFAYEQALQRQQMLQQQAEIGRNQSNLDRQFELEQQKYGTDLATALAEQRLNEQKLTGQNQGGLEFSNLDPTSKAIAQISNAAGGNTQMAQQYFNLARDAVSGISATGQDAAALAGNQFQFIQYVRQVAQSKGLDPILAQSAAAAYWQNIFGVRQ